MDAQWSRISGLTNHMLMSEIGVVDESGFAEEVCELRRGHSTQTVAVLRTLLAETWLRHLRDENFWKHAPLNFEDRGPVKRQVPQASLWTNFS